MSFCTYAEQDDIREPSLTPWVGFVYTFPEYRGKRHMGILLERAFALAEDDGHEHVYISTGEKGLYEKYGYSFWKNMKNMDPEEASECAALVGAKHSIPYHVVPPDKGLFDRERAEQGSPDHSAFSYSRCAARIPTQPTK